MEHKTRIKISKLADKYFPCHGCDNCWGDLHQGCTDKCRNEFKIHGEFIRDIHNLLNDVGVI